MIYLPDLVKQGAQSNKIEVQDRLPHFVHGPCTLTVNYEAIAQDDYYLLKLTVTAPLELTCQRCLDEFKLTYVNDTQIAVCRDDKRAEELLEHYECVVSSTWQIDLKEILIDELHLYAPSAHQQLTDCSIEVNQVLMNNQEPK